MWNDRSKQFTGEKTSSVLWKDAKIDAWVDHLREITFHIKCTNRLGLEAQNAIISRIIYKHHNQMRRDKPFQTFKRVNLLVGRYSQMEILHHLINYKEILQTMKSKRSVPGKDVLIPAEDFTLFIIERLYGSFHLAIKIIEYCEHAYIYLDSHMRLGFFVSFNLFAIASVSRIWAIFKEIIRITKLLFPFFKDLLRTCYPVNESYSSDLKNLLEIDLDEDPFTSTQRFALSRPKKNEERGENSGLKVGPSDQSSIPFTQTGLTDEDIGEPISLSELSACGLSPIKRNEYKSVKKESFSPNLMKSDEYEPIQKEASPSDEHIAGTPSLNTLFTPKKAKDSDEVVEQVGTLSRRALKKGPTFWKLSSNQSPSCSICNKCFPLRTSLQKLFHRRICLKASRVMRRNRRKLTNMITCKYTLMLPPDKDQGGKGASARLHVSSKGENQKQIMMDIMNLNSVIFRCSRCNDIFPSPASSLSRGFKRQICGYGHTQHLRRRLKNAGDVKHALVHSANMRETMFLNMHYRRCRKIARKRCVND